MTVLKVIELIASSPESWEEATRQAIAKATGTLTDIKSATVKEQSVVVRDGKVESFRVTLKVAFEVR